MAAATVAYADIDAPFNVIDTITLEDTNGKPIVGPFGGYDLYLTNKYGGYVSDADVKDAGSDYIADTGTTAPHNVDFQLYIPVELVARDAVGALPNKSGTNKFRVKIRIAASATVYTTPPTQAPTVRVRMSPQNWMEPNDVDSKGRPLAQNPPALNTTQYWTKGVYTLSSGDNRVQIQQGLGYLIRNYIFVSRNTSNVRSSTTDGQFPDPFSLQYEANLLFDKLVKLWRYEIYNRWGYNVAVATSDVAASTGGGGRDFSVYPLPFTDDFGLRPGAELRRGYLETSDGSRMEARGSWGAAHNLHVLANYVAPANGDDASITV